ncbi:MAG TPA: Type 1 glutamine amidotransferase-like domain-containing protein [Rubrivivax sp.]|nr:Type 1 glutamine amidotransferase-like domain-containing protein [Rubrivivax sp.]
MRDHRQIFGIGGTFYNEPWERPLLQQHMLGLVKVSQPRIAFLGTATGDSAADIERFYRAMAAHRCTVSHLNLFEPHTDDFETYFCAHDIVYVGGGSTRNMLTLWRDWGIDRALRRAWEAGVLMAGTSAGSICWFEGCITDSLPSRLMPLQGLGFIAGSASTHYQGRPDRPSCLRQWVGDGTLPGPAIATEDHVALHYVGVELSAIVSARSGAGAYRIERGLNGAIETRLPVVALDTQEASRSRLTSG